MTPVFRVRSNRIGPTLRAYAATMGRELKDVVRRAARGITRRVIDITPPSSQGKTGAEAYRAGRFKIANQMSALLAPVKIKGRRKITTVYGRKLKKPIYVPTKEKHPDVAALYRANTHASRSGLGIRITPGRKFYVDTRKFSAVLRERQSRVGALASGWSAASAALDLPVQNWITRHGTFGGLVRIETAGSRMRVTAENLAPGVPAAIRSELARRIPYAVQYQRDAMEREIAAMHAKSRGDAGISGS